MQNILTATIDVINIQVAFCYVKHGIIFHVANANTIVYSRQWYPSAGNGIPKRSPEQYVHKHMALEGAGKKHLTRLTYAL